jgi:flagellar hook-associated protein 2
VQDENSPFSALSDIGIETELDGTLTVDDTALGEALNDEFVKFGQLFSATDGFAVRLYDLTDSLLSDEGIVESRTSGLQTQIDDLGDQREALNERLAALETRLLRQFNALDSLLAQLSSTSNFLAQQLTNLPGAERSGQ